MFIKNSLLTYSNPLMDYLISNTIVLNLLISIILQLKPQSDINFSVQAVLLYLLSTRPDSKSASRGVTGTRPKLMSRLVSV